MYKCGLYTYQLDRRLYGDIMDGLDNRAGGLNWRMDGCMMVVKEQAENSDVQLMWCCISLDLCVIKV